MLRSEDVADKTFTTTRLREGYEIAEVDEFRVELAEAIAFRDRVINDLQEELATVRVRLAEMVEAQSGEPREPLAPVHDVEVSHDGERRESSVYAARLLERAAVNADQLVAEAQNAADSLMSAARAEAEQLLAASRSDAERVTVEIDRHRTQVLAEVEDIKSGLEARIATLRQQEDDNRSRLRRHFAEQLAQLDEGTPTTLRAVGD
jgi:DivIVA domain-containing protein